MSRKIGKIKRIEYPDHKSLEFKYEYEGKRFILQFTTKGVEPKLPFLLIEEIRIVGSEISILYAIDSDRVSWIETMGILQLCNKEDIISELEYREKKEARERKNQINKIKEVLRMGPRIR